jgi:hypothetical protein
LADVQSDTGLIVLGDNLGLNEMEKKKKTMKETEGGKEKRKEKDELMIKKVWKKCRDKYFNHME